MKLLVTKEQLKRDLDLIKQAKHNVYGKPRKDGHHLSVFLQGPFYFHVRPKGCELEDKVFPGDFFTVHLGYRLDEDPAVNPTKYYCSSYASAKSLAEKMKEDKGIEIVEIVK